MQLQFSKYQGTGNDFILIDDRKEKFPKKNQVIKKLCDRKFGVGADGLILIQNHPNVDYKMIYFNSDGSQSLCANGSRCGFAYARTLEMVQDVATFKTTDGVHKIKFQNNLIHFQLFDVEYIKKLENNQWYVDIGSPHHIVITQEEQKNIIEEGRKIRNLPVYSNQNGTNVNFAQPLKNKISIRTYERGVEDETLSCGTGATSVGLVASEMGYKSPVMIETKGGVLMVSFRKLEKGFSDIWLAGSVEKTFDGNIII